MYLRILKGNIYSLLGWLYVYIDAICHFRRNYFYCFFSSLLLLFLFITRAETRLKFATDDYNEMNINHWEVVFIGIEFVCDDRTYTRLEEGEVFGREIAFTLSHYRRGPNETNNMLATPDDISNLNLNNLAESALGLWDHARVFLLSFPVLSFSLSRSVVLPCHPLFLAMILFLFSFLSFFLSFTHTCRDSWHSHTQTCESICELLKSLLFSTQR